MRPPDACCALGRACVPVHVLLHARGLCHCGWAPCSCTHVCAPCVRVHTPSVLSCFVLALSTRTAHSLCKHCTCTLCTLTAGSMCQPCRFTLMPALSTRCLLCAHSFHTHRALSVCALCKHCTHPLCSHFLLKCCVRVHATCSMHTLHTVHTRNTHPVLARSQRPCRLSGHSAHSTCTLCTLCAVLAARSICALPMGSSCSAHPLCTLCAHLLHTLVHPVCTVHCPPARPMHACSVLHAHPLAHSPRALIACSLRTRVCFLHAPCTLVPARKPLKRCPRKMGDGRGELWVGSIGN